MSPARPHDARGTRALRLVLIGSPVARSRSRELFCELECHDGPRVRYELLETAPGDLRRTLDGLRRGSWDGANVTIPHKGAACKIVDRLDRAARACGAINVVSREQGMRLRGASTDGAGFVAGLLEQFGELDPGHAVLCGTGGAARSVARALTDRGWTASFASRAPASPTLAGLRASSPGSAILRWEDEALGAELARANLVIQATPLGSPSHPEESPPLPWECVRPAVVAVDLVYEPWETPFLVEARRRGLGAANGWPMLVHQAALALDVWAGPGRGRSVIERSRRIERRDPRRPG